MKYLKYGRYAVADTELGLQFNTVSLLLLQLFTFADYEADGNRICFTIFFFSAKT